MSINEEEKLKKLKNMRKVATGLLILMTIVYISLKRFESNSFIISCVVAFAEASMVGALADWFAVVALFRHPLGQRWIPHTAIIQKNQERIGDSLASFVVDNFFTEEILRQKLSDFNVTSSIVKLVRENRLSISMQASAQLPEIINYTVSRTNTKEALVNSSVVFLKKLEVSPYIDNLLDYCLSSKAHVPLLKKAVGELYDYVNNNEHEVRVFLEGFNKIMTIPVIGDYIVSGAYNKINDTLFSLKNDMEEGRETPLTKELLNNLPEKLVKKFHDSENLHSIIELKKNEFLESEKYIFYINDLFDTVSKRLYDYSINSQEKISVFISDSFEKLIIDFDSNEVLKNKADNWLTNNMIQLVDSYKSELGKIISDTVKNWPMEDMVQKLEVQVGGDLQYIRINGTVIGGMAGLLIHLISYFMQ